MKHPWIWLFLVFVAANPATNPNEYAQWTHHFIWCIVYFGLGFNALKELYIWLKP